MNEYLKFDKFITPVMLQILWWIGNLGFLLFFLKGMTTEHVEKGPVLGVFVVGIIAWRVWCELMLLAFKIYDRLGDNKA
jgi:hypothetical protein